MNPSDNKKLAGEIFARTGIAINPDDPIFVLVELNRLVLDDQKTDLEEIRASFDASAQNASEALTQKIGLLHLAAEDYQKKIERFTNDAAQQLVKKIESDRKELDHWITEKAANETGAIVKEVTQAIKKTVGATVANEVRAPLTAATGKLFALCFGCGLIGSLVGIGALWLAFGVR